jgi:hypothetical protein
MALESEAGMSDGKRHEFRVVIEGIELPDEVVQEINESIQRAAGSAVARIDLKGGPAWTGLGNPLHTLGIWYYPTDRDDVERALRERFETP